MGAASTCQELVCAPYDDTLAPPLQPATRQSAVSRGLGPRKRRAPCAAPGAAAALQRTGAASAPNIEALWQEYRRYVAVDTKRLRATRGCAIAAARLAESLWRIGRSAEAAPLFADAQARCEDFAEDSPGARAELLLAEIILSRALTLRHIQTVSPDELSTNVPLSLLHRTLGLAQRHLVGVQPWSARAALLSAVAVHNIGLFTMGRGDWGRARDLFEEALGHLCGARAAGFPHGSKHAGSVTVVPRHAYLEQIQKNLMLATAAGAGVDVGAMCDPEFTSVVALPSPEAPSWWRHGGLAGQLDLQGAADAALVHRLCASALLMGDGGDAEARTRDLDTEDLDEPEKCGDEARCELWLDIANGYQAKGDAVSAQVYRERAYRHAKNMGLNPSAPARRLAWAEQRRVQERQRSLLPQSEWPLLA